MSDRSYVGSPIQLDINGNLRTYPDAYQAGFDAGLAVVARREARLRAAIANEIDRLWKIAYQYNQWGEGSIGLLVDMTNAIGGLDSLRQQFAAPHDPATAPRRVTLARDGHADTAE